MRDAESDELIGQTLGNKFLVRRRLGSGGMGAVYEAEHLITKRIGALKLLHPSITESGRIVARFLREASAAGRIGNPHIVETLDAGELAGGQPYIFMELLEGTPVSELIARRGRLSFAEAREIVLQAAEGLSAAHAAGIVHRDVKPANLMLCAGEPTYVKLLDFGISKFESASDPQLTADGAPLGTPYYMSPEQVAGKRDIGPSSDIYSIGVVLYECVTGKVPFDAETLPALSIKIFEGRYAPPSTMTGSRVAGLDEIIARAMATLPSKRYASMSELRDVLQALDPGLPLRSEAFASVTQPVLSTSDRQTNTGIDSLAPPTVTSRKTANYRQSWAIAALVALGLVVSFVLERPSTALSPATGSESVATTRIEPPTEPSVVPSSPPPVMLATAAGSVAIPRPAPPAARSAQPVSKAARDGLSEQNPFD